MHSLRQDIVGALRFMRRRPSFTLLAIGTLALGMGASTAMFSVADRLLFAALPYRDPGQLVTIWQTAPEWRGKPILGQGWDRLPIPYPSYRELADSGRTLSGVAAVYWAPDARLTADGETAEIPIASGSASLLPLLGVQPELGRWFLPGEEGAGAPPLVVLSHALWSTKFGADPRVLGRSIELDDAPYTVIGILPRDFRFRSVGQAARATDIRASWVPIGAGRRPRLQANSDDYEVIGRLHFGVKPAQAADEAARLMLRNRDPKLHGARIVDRKEAESGDLRSTVLGMTLAVGVLLALTCLNFAVLLLGEGAAREREIATRMMLGAGRRRIIRQQLVESVVLSTVAGVVGIVVATVLVRFLVLAAPDRLARFAEVGVNWRSFGFAFGIAVAAGTAAGLIPALHTVSNPGTGARAGNRNTTARAGQLQRWLVSGQVALAMLLLVGGGLLTRSMLRQSAVHPGFRSDHLLLATIGLPSSRYPAPAQIDGYFTALTARIAGMPGVRTVSMTTSAPLADELGSWAINPTGETQLDFSSPTTGHQVVASNYFQTMQISLLAGRGLLPTDRDGAERVAIINEAMARHFWPDASPLGRRFFAPNGGLRTVVGVVANSHHVGLGRPPVESFYESLDQAPSRVRTLLVVSTGDPMLLAPIVTSLTREADRLVPIRQLVAMETLLKDSFAPERFRLMVLGYFGLTAIALTVVGVLGTVLRTIAARMRELCIRMAIGATPANAAQLILREFAVVAVLGVGVGGLASLFLMRVVNVWLYGVTSHDATTYTAVAALLLAATMLATWAPLRKLARADLLTHLRRE